jgi:hypothetical protein
MHGRIARRGLLQAAGGLSAAPVPDLRAQGGGGGGGALFPNRPLRLVSPFNPGGAIDVLNRMLAERASAVAKSPTVYARLRGRPEVLET